MEPLVWSVLFAVLMLCMVAVELLTPSMGGFTIAALGSSVLSVFSGFRHSMAAGWTMLAANVALFPAAMFVGFHVLKKSPIVNQVQNPGGIINAPDARPLAKLAGEVGKTLTPLRPAGAAMIDGMKIDVMTEGKFVEAGTVVRVIRVSGSSVFVEPEKLQI